MTTEPLFFVVHKVCMVRSEFVLDSIFTKFEDAATRQQALRDKGSPAAPIREMTMDQIKLHITKDTLQSLSEPIGKLASGVADVGQLTFIGYQERSFQPNYGRYTPWHEVMRNELTCPIDNYIDRMLKCRVEGTVTTDIREIYASKHIDKRQYELDQPLVKEIDEGDPLWLVNEQIKGLLEGDGSSEDHNAVMSFLRSTGLPYDTVERMHKAIVHGDSKCLP